MQKSFYVLAIMATIAITTVVVANLSLAQRSDGPLGPKIDPIHHQLMADIMTNRDFTAWQKLMTGQGKASKLTEADFNKLADSWQAMQNGDYAAMEQFRQGLGFGRGWGMIGGNRGWGMMNGERGLKSDLKKGGCQQNGCGRQFMDANNDGICDHAQLKEVQVIN